MFESLGELVFKFGEIPVEFVKVVINDFDYSWGEILVLLIVEKLREDGTLVESLWAILNKKT